MYPVRNTVYTARQVLTVLTLKDSAFFKFRRHSPFQRVGDGKDADRLQLMEALSFGVDVDCVLQNSHVTDKELLSVPGFAESRWEYLFTTDEWIPIFRLASDQPRDEVERWFDLEHEIGEYGQLINSWSVTPKGFPREQYYLDSRSRWQACMDGHRSFDDAHRSLHHMATFKVPGLSWLEGEDCPTVVEATTFMPNSTNVVVAETPSALDVSALTDEQLKQELEICYVNYRYFDNTDDPQSWEKEKLSREANKARLNSLKEEQDRRSSK